MNSIVPLDWYVFRLFSPPTLPIPFIFAVFILFTTSGWWFLQKKLSYPPYSTSHKTLVLLQRVRCVMKASFLWENWLSTVTHPPPLELITVAFPITPVFKLVAWVSWQEPQWSGWVRKGSICPDSFFCVCFWFCFVLFLDIFNKSVCRSVLTTFPTLSLV